MVEFLLTFSRFPLVGIRGYLLDHSGVKRQNRSRDFEKYCKRTGVIQQITAPKTPQQNGTVERAGKTVMGMRSFMVNTGLPKRLGSNWLARPSF